jgi:hypothetical protein
MSTELHQARPGGNHQSALGEPAAEHPGLWSVVQRAHRARLIYSDGPDYRCLIVDYDVYGWGIEVELPMREVAPGDLDEREVTMEILDHYLSMTVEHVHLFGRVQRWDGAAPGARCLLGRPGAPGRTYVIAVRLLALHGERDQRSTRSHRHVAPPSAC